MEVLQLNIPPLPQFLTAGSSVWKPEMQHFQRSFEVYDLLIVCSGTLFITEGEVQYEVRGGEVLLLEPGKIHYGHLPCIEDSAIYWVHFKHAPPVKSMTEKSIPWSTLVRRGTDGDLAADEQGLFLPKYGKVDLIPLKPILEEIIRLRDSLTLEHAFNLQLAMNRLLSQLQAGLKSSRSSPRAYAVAEQAKRYLQLHLSEPFRAEQMADELHFHVDYAARCLKKHTGMSPLQYHHFMRMEEAKRLLVHSTMQIQEVSLQVGFSDYNYFIRTFRQTVGMTPGEFRRSLHGSG